MQTENLDKLKFIPLISTKNNYLTIGGESRLRYEYYHNEGLSNLPYSTNGYFQQRTMLHADLHVAKYFRLFTQLSTSTTHGRKGGARPVVDQDKLDLNQAFFDISFQQKNNSYYLRTGRQELYFGNGKLVDPREGPNARLNFDAICFIATTKKVRVDAFVSQPVNTKNGFFDNTRNTNTLFWGLYSTWKLSKQNNLGLDIYYFGIRNKAALFEKGTGEEVRHTVGFRFFGSYKGFGIDYENMLQAGTFSNYNILAWATTLNISYQLPASLLHTKIGLGGAINSGDKGIGNTHLGTYNALFPTGFYFGPPAIILGPANLMGVSPSFVSVITKKILFLPNWNFFWRQSLTDGIYAPNTFLLRRGAATSSRYIGNQLNLTLRWQVTPHIVLLPSYARFNSGDFLKDTAPSMDIDYFNIDLTFKF